MKLAEIVKILSAEFGTSDLKEINKAFKANPDLKFRLTGEALGHYGFTGQIKSVSEEGFKVHTANRVVLIRLEEIETFGKPNSREEREARKLLGTKKPVKTPPAKSKKSSEDDIDDDDDEDDDFEDFDDEDMVEDKPELKKNKTRPSGKSGSKFIPTKK